MNSVGLLRIRVTVFLVSLVAIILEIALLRELALRFWEHLAWLVISIALLGFGASGTLLVLVQRFSRITNQVLGSIALFGLALSIPFSLLLGGVINADLLQMAWQPAQFWKLGILEIVFALPFIFCGTYIGLALQDKPGRVPGHYGASFIGSGIGGVVILPALFIFSPRPIMLGCAVLVFAAALSCARGTMRTAGGFCAGLLLALMIWQLPRSTEISADKDLPQLMAMPGSEIVASRSGPQGLVNIVQAPAFHGGPGLSLNNTEPLPDQLLVTLDGQIIGSLYHSTGNEGFAFLDNTTMALAYQLQAEPSRVLIGPEAGTAQISLALYHGADLITALTDNSSLTRLKTVDLASHLGHLYKRPEVSLFTATLRGFLYNHEHRYSLIDLPVVGSDLGGLKAATTSPLLSLDTFKTCFDRLEETGVLSVTTQAHVPPRESLRLLNMLVELLRSRGRDPRNHVAIIRSWASVTLVAAKSEITSLQTSKIRSFCRTRGFDLVWLPDLQPSEVNRYHSLDEPQYYLAALNLMGSQKSSFVSRYIYDLTSPVDDRPFFHHFSRLDMGTLTTQLGRRSRSYAEIGKLLLVAAAVQALILAFTLIIAPMIPVLGIPGGKTEQLLVITFFSAIGFGFMFLEMGLLQRLEIYLGHPVYAAAAVITGFLFFGGLGSIASSSISEPLASSHCLIGFAVAALAIVYLMQLDTLLSITEGLVLFLRLTIVMLITSPLALLMGMMFPLGLKRLGRAHAKLIPWAWSVNGFTSVVATLLAPLLAMHWGFGAVGWTAAACYALAAILSLGLPARQ